jgi:endonuclease/exonuclease/phosphatase family metal-dependent hydrolase
MVQEYLKDFCQDGEPAANLMGLFFDNMETTNQETAYRGHAICTKGYPISDYRTHLFSNAGDTNYQGYETAKITVCGKTIHLINTHNNYRTSPQAIHMTEVLAAIEPMEYFILCGDFNIDLQTEDKTDVQYLQSVKPFYDRGYHMANFNDQRGWLKTYYGTAEATNGKFTDNIVTSANIEIISASIDETKLTDAISDKIDHLPIIAKLSIQ